MQQSQHLILNIEAAAGIECRERSLPASIRRPSLSVTILERAGQHLTAHPLFQPADEIETLSLALPAA